MKNKIKNLPDWALECEFVVVKTYSDGEQWFFDATDDEKTARIMSWEIPGGCVYRMQDCEQM